MIFVLISFQISEKLPLTSEYGSNNFSIIKLEREREMNMAQAAQHDDEHKIFNVILVGYRLMLLHVVGVRICLLLSYI